MQWRGEEAHRVQDSDSQVHDDSSASVPLVSTRRERRGSDASAREQHELSGADYDSDLEIDGDIKPYTPDEERAVVRALDRRLVLFVSLLYLLAFLDRSNIGNAKLAGMTVDLGLSASQLQWVLDGFYITYILFEVLTLCYRIFPPHKYISICVLAMGALASLQSLSTGFTSLLVLRLLLGIAEAAFGPGIPVYLSFFFKRDEMARRLGYFIAAAPLASAFSGGLAWIIVRLGPATGIDGWRLLFIAEGFPNVMLAVLAWYQIPDSPATVPWLGHREREVASLRMERESRMKHVGHELTSGMLSKRHSRPNWRHVLTTLKDPKCYVIAAILFSCNIAFSSMPVFAPSIIAEMGFDPLSSQGLTAFPNIVAFVIVLLTARISDEKKTRSVPIMIHACLAMTGYIALALAPVIGLPSILRYLCLFPVISGFFSVVVMVLVWTVNNQETDEGKAVGSSLLQVFGHLGSLLAQNLYPDADAPDYSKGHAVCAFFMLMAAVLAGVLRAVLQRANERREVAKAKAMEWDVGRPLVKGSGGDAGVFRYML